jgi:hypothetical protein
VSAPSRRDSDIFGTNEERAAATASYTTSAQDAQVRCRAKRLGVGSWVCHFPCCGNLPAARLLEVKVLLH